MRTKTTGVAKIIAHPTHSAKVSASVYTRTGTWVADIDEDLLGVEVTNSVDALSGCTLKVRRQYGQNDNVPIMSGMFLVGSLVIVYCTVAPADLDYGTEIELFSGRVDRVDWAEDAELVTLTGKVEADARDTWIETELVYGFCQGTYATRGARVWSSALSSSALGGGELCIPSDAQRNGHFYRVTTAGTPGSTEPTWPTTSGATVGDGTVTWTESGSTSDTTGVPVEDLIQQILDANGLSAYTLSVPSSPGWQVKPYLQNNDYVWNAIKRIVDQFGWVLRWAWTGSTWELVLLEPERTGGSSVRTFALDEQLELTEVGMEIFDIRNVVRVVYSDSADRDSDGIAKRKIYEASDATSISTFGRRFMQLAESDTSSIDTATEAQTLANSCLADLKNATINVIYRTGIDPYLELGDLVTVLADNQHWAANQTLALIEVNHSISSSGAFTVLRFYGTPVSQRRGWHRMDARGRQTSEEPTSLASGSSFTLTASNVVGGTRFDINSGNIFKSSLARAFEIHVSTTSGFTPSSSTLKQSGVTTTCTVADLTPGQTYYAKAVPYSFVSGGRVVRGEPSDELTLIPGLLRASHVSTMMGTGAYPLNGAFEEYINGTGSPPDGWTTDGSWGVSTSNPWYYAVDDYGGHGTSVVARGSTSADTSMVSGALPLPSSKNGVIRAWVKWSGGGGSGSGNSLGLLLLTSVWNGSSLVTSLVGGSIIATSGTDDATTKYISSSDTWTEVTFRVTLGGGTYEPTDKFWIYILRPTRTGTTVFNVGSVEFIPDLPEMQWLAPTLNTGWANYGSGWHAAGYMKDSMGFVHLRGLVTRSSGSATTIFTLPSGYRPLGGHIFTASVGDAYGRIDINTDGTVVVSIGDPSYYASLAGISFDTR